MQSVTKTQGRPSAEQSVLVWAACTGSGDAACRLRSILIAALRRYAQAANQLACHVQALALLQRLASQITQPLLLSAHRCAKALHKPAWTKAW